MTPVQVGGTLSGSLSSPGQWADYTFSGGNGQAVYLEHGAACTPPIEWELVAVRRRRSSSTVRATTWTGSTSPTAGTYTIRFAGDHATIGPYSFSLLAVPATVVTPITVGQTVSGSLTSAGQQADYTFSATAGEVIQAHALGSCVDGLEWQLIGPGGTLLDFSVACHDLGRDTLATAGTYTIRELGDQTSVGAYSFALSPGS